MRESWTIARLRNVLVLVLVAGVSLVVLLSFSSEREVVWAEATRVGTDKQVIASAGAKRMEEFFQRVEVDLHTLAQTDAVVGLESSEARRIMEGVVDRYAATPLLSLVRVDAGGRVTVSVNRQRLAVGEDIDVSDRDYFVWAEAQRQDTAVFLSAPLAARAGPKEGEKVVIIAVPVTKGEEFDGLLFASLGLQTLVSDYAANLAVYQGTEVLILDQDERILAGFLRQDVSGRKVGEIVKSRSVEQQQAYARVVDDMLNGVNSWAEVEISLPGGDGAQPWIAGFAPVEFGLRRWILVVLVSNREVFGRLDAFRNYAQLAIFVVGIGAAIVGGLSILGMRQAQLVWYKRGFYAAQDKRKKVLKAIGLDKE